MSLISVDDFIEIFSVIKRNRLRTILTGFSIAWGIFMLVLLLGSSKGLQNSIEEDFKDWNNNGIWVWPGIASKPFKGQAIGRDIKLYDEDTKGLQKEINVINNASSILQLTEEGEGVAIRYEGKNTLAELKAVQPDYILIEYKKMVEGRFINPIDEKKARMVISVSASVRNLLFGQKEAIGRSVFINATSFKIVGVFEEKKGEKNIPSVFIPISTAQKIYTRNRQIHMMAFSTKQPLSEEDNNQVLSKIKSRVATKNNFSRYDPTALNFFEVSKSVAIVSNIFNGLRTFIWIICFMTLLSGMIGIGNIMIVTVNERIKEIGIKIAIGATPFHIILSIIVETVIITFAAGFIGLFLGIFTVHYLFRFLPSLEYFKDPAVDLTLAVSATLILIISGTVAGLIPAIKASTIRPVEALKDI